MSDSENSASTRSSASGERSHAIKSITCWSASVGAGVNWAW